MLLKSKKYIFILLGILIILLIFLLIIYFDFHDKTLKVIFLDIGQGDSILIRTPDKQDILIDGGPDNRVVDKLGQYLPFWDRDIELMILTHVHSDHIMGLIEVLKRYQVEKILYSGRVDYATSDYLTWLDFIEEKEIPLQVGILGQKYHLGDNLDLDILYPFQDFSGQKFEDLNDSSMVVRLDFEEIEFVFTGDASEKIEKEILAQNLELESEVLKVGHHGSKYSSSREFLEAINPQYAVIQSGEGNKFGHPHFKTLNNLEKLGIRILRNDQLGDIKFKTNGQDLELVD